MPDMITIALAFLALLAFLGAIAAIGWLSRVSRHLSALRRRVLEFEDMQRIIEAADKTVFFESRMAGCESKADESQSQLLAHEIKRSELAARLGVAERIVEGHASGLAKASEDIASLGARLAGFENNVGEKLNQLMQHETKLNELATRMGSVEQMANDSASGLAGANRSIEALASEIQSLKEFQTAAEETRSRILAAFTDTRANVPPEQGMGTALETAKPADTSQSHREGRAEAEDQETPVTYHYP